MVVILSFGGVLITYVYLISTGFKDVVTASKCIAPVLIVFGNVIPIAAIAIISYIVDYAVRDDGFGVRDTSIWIFYLVLTIFYFTNPFLTFLVNAYTILMVYFIEEKNRIR